MKYIIILLFVASSLFSQIDFEEVYIADSVKILDFEIQAELLL